MSAARARKASWRAAGSSVSNFNMPTLNALISGKLRSIALVCLAVFVPRLAADVTVSALFADRMVLQREMPVRVWGDAAPGEKVSVEFGGQSHRATAAADGSWAVVLSPMPASSEGRELRVTGSNAIVLRDVLVGEVWLCSGQSNMAWTIDRVIGASEIIVAPEDPGLRQFTVGRATPDSRARSLQGSWQKAGPETVARFTAVGYFFARQLRRELGVPVGLVNSSWGGTPIEAWMSPRALAESGVTEVAARWQASLQQLPANRAAYEATLATWTSADHAARAEGEVAHRAFLQANPRPVEPSNIRPSSGPSRLFHGMIAPLTPLTIRGVLWYQGEGNAGRPAEYARLFPAMIQDWRREFGQAEMPFFWVQLPNFASEKKPDGDSWARLREAQADTLALPATGQAVVIDVGDPDDIHPRNKHDVGDRLARLALARVYGRTTAASGPVFEAVRPEVGGRLRVSFRHAAGLQARGGPVREFEVAGADGVFVRAEAVIEGESVVVSAPGVAAPVAVRYAWRNAPEVNLFNGAGLPAAPFRSQR